METANGDILVNKQKEHRGIEPGMKGRTRCCGLKNHKRRCESSTGSQGDEETSGTPGREQQGWRAEHRLQAAQWKR